jgi:hypothetical protein
MAIISPFLSLKNPDTEGRLSGTLPTDRRRSLILDLVAKYTYKILSANVCLVGIAVLRMTEVKVRFSLIPDYRN